MPAGPTVVISTGPPNEAWTTILDYGGGSTILYSGLARSAQDVAYVFGVSSVSKAAAAVVTTAANHGLSTGQNVVIAGGVGDWVGLNGTLTVTVLSPTTFSVAVDSSLFAGSFAGRISSNSPLTILPIWAIQQNAYNGGSQLVNQYWAKGSVGLSNIWDNRASLAYQ